MDPASVSALTFDVFGTVVDWRSSIIQPAMEEVRSGRRPWIRLAAHPGDLAAAARSGLRTAYVPRPLEHGPGRGANAPKPGQVFDVVAGDFVELAEKLGC